MLQSTKQEKITTQHIFHEEQLEGIDFNSIPKHVAIIMDGNRRWAIQKNLPYELGYVKGAERLKETVQAAMELKIETLTVYAFSTENWKRPKEEVDILLDLFKEYLIAERTGMAQHGICLTTIGDVSVFNNELKEALVQTRETTKGGDKLNLVLALNYGGRDDLLRAFRRIAQGCVEEELQVSQISESLIDRYLDTAEFTDPDLLIRTSGEFRISNFLVWQLAYTEVNVLKDYWPEFSSEHLLRAVNNYIKRERRCGI